MKKLSIVFIWVAVLSLSSCSKKTPEFVHSIPDDAIAVVSLNPMQIHTKSKINTFASIKEKVKNEVWGAIIEDPLSTGLDVNEYAYVFFRMEDDGPIIGLTARMKDQKKFEATLTAIHEGIADEFQTNDVYTWVQPDKEGIIGWNNKQLIILASPDHDEFETSFFTGSLDKMFNPVREESLTSLVDFKDFLGKMKDLNLWASSDEMFDILKKMGGDKIPDIPVTLYNNYAQVFVEFANGAININGETHFSEEVEKNIEEVLVMKPELNEKMLNLAPGGNLLLAVAGSMDLAKMEKLVEKFAPPEMDTVGNKIEKATGMNIKDLLASINGDFTIAINGVEGESMIPIEVFLGVGVNGKALQETLMEKVDGMAPVEEEGDFFIINIQGNEIYSGIINDVLVLTNAKGYKDALKNDAFSPPLKSSRFGDFADGSVGLFVNLNMDDYPAMVQGLLSQKPERKHWVERLTDPFDYIGISASNYKNKMVVKTSDPAENSLYTVMKMIASPE
jgi:hypothetical protein